MAIKRPTQEQMRHIVEDLGMSMPDAEVQFYLDNMEGIFERYDLIDELPDNLPEVRYPRTSGYRPGPEENPHGAWYWKTTIKGADSGPLAGKTLAIKDNICVAGVPMMNGASTLEGYTPEIDATVVERILDAGGTILGKATCEYFCLSGGSHTSSPRAVENPRKPGYSAGGSSSGSGALLVTEEVDMTLGGDQGGSIRMPSAYCGVVGLKPTHGLVPYTGIMPIELTIDHTGPMTRTVAENAQLLEVIAGPDGLDPRQHGVEADNYVEALGQGVSGLRIGVLKEGFGHPNSEPEVDEKVRAAAKHFEALGAEVKEVSAPWHSRGLQIWTPLAIEGLHWQMMIGNGFGMNWKGLYVTSMIDAHANWRARADELSKTLKICMLTGEYGIRNYRGRFYAKCQNIARQLKADYDRLFAEVDLLLMPTLPLKATKLPQAGDPPEDVFARAFEMLANTAPFDVTGQPAMSLPCGMSDGLPIGCMLVAKDYKETTIYRAAQAYERSVDWTAL